jgi:uncharacterized protein (DUF58 family)
VSIAANAEPVTPVAVTLRELIQLKPAGEMIKLATPRVRALDAGGNLSPFKGRGIEFDESRPYQEGDDLRTIDWRVTARTGKPHTKVFREERNRPVILWLDLTRSMMFGTQVAYKAVVAARSAAIVGWSAIANGDQLGGLVFNEDRHEELRPRLGRRAALRLMQLIVADPAWRAGRSGNGAGAATSALQRLARVTRPGSQVFLFSDFLRIDGGYEKLLRQLANHSDVHLIHIYDPIEAELPPPGRYRIDIGNKVHTIDTSDQTMRTQYREAFEERSARLKQLARMPGVRLLSLATSEDPAAALLKVFVRR